MYMVHNVNIRESYQWETQSSVTLVPYLSKEIGCYFRLQFFQELNYTVEMGS